MLLLFTSGACPHELRRSNPFIYASRQTVHTWLLVICLNVSFFLAFRDGANEAEGGMFVGAFRERYKQEL